MVIVLSQPISDTVLLVQNKGKPLVQIFCFSGLFCKKRLCIKIVSSICQLFYRSFIKLSFWGLNLEFYRNKESRHSFQMPKKAKWWLKVVPFEAWFARWKLNLCQLLSWYFDRLGQIPSFSVHNIQKASKCTDRSEQLVKTDTSAIENVQIFDWKVGSHVAFHKV